MCGRYQFTDERDIEEVKNIIREIDRKYNGTVSYKTGEIFPTNTVPVLVAGSTLQLMAWGFPRWDNKGVVINAKSETAAEKKMFAKSLHERRCVIPSTGFFEWQQRSGEKSKDKFLFNSPQDDVLYMAGIYNVFQTGETTDERFVIFTRAANDSIGDVHDRMPVILYKNEIDDWLSDTRFSELAFRRDNVLLERKIV